MKLSEISALLGLPIDRESEITGFCIDSRVLKPGNVFIALIGEKFDGHHFILTAVEKGACAIICQTALKQVSIPQLVVLNTLKALAILATAHRSIMQGPVIALTGSNGKTTVKEMIANILPDNSLATVGNLNNHIGAPLSVLKLKKTHPYAVFELGANHAGDIAYTVAMVQPDVALINNIAPAHIEGFGSIDGVANTKGEIYQGLKPQGIAIVNADDDYAHFWDNLLVDKKIYRFSAFHKSDIYAESIQVDSDGCMQFTLVLPIGRGLVHLQVPGKHNMQNALAAASCCFAVGISVMDIVEGLNQFTGVSGRMTYKLGKNKSTVIDDTYNANLRSVLIALEVLAQCKGKRIFVFGDMGELGALTVQHHQEVGMVAKQLEIDLVMTCGAYSAATAESFGDCAKHYPNQESLVQDLLVYLDAGTTILVKGSRSSTMEKIVEQLV